ncbi:hypothetical protein V8D89_004047 [Ganoderma adspersum]
MGPFLLYSAQWAAQGIIVSATGLLSLRSSQSLLASLTTFGTGRLIAASFLSFFYSVFVVAAYALYAPGSSSPRFSPAAFSISHIAGILLMLVADRSLSSRTLDTSPPAGLDSDALPASIAVTQAEDAAAQPLLASQTTRSFGLHQCRIYLFTFAFVVQEMAGGISFDYGSTAPTWLPGSDDQHLPSLAGTVRRFLPELVGETATALGFATTLLTASLPVAECKRHVLLYAAARPVSALLAYCVATLSRTTPASHWPPIVILYSFTSGLVVSATFVVRTRLIVNSRTTTARLGQLSRASLMAAGAFLPYILSVAVTLAPFGSHNGTPAGRDTAGAEAA